MWAILILLAVSGSVLFLHNRQVPGILIMIGLATSGFQFIPSNWYESPLLLSKAYDYAYFEVGIIFLFSTTNLRELFKRESIARDSVYFCGFVVLISMLSWIIYSYDIIQIIQSARLFLWPAFLLLFLCAEKEVLNDVVKALFPIVFICCILYIQQPFTGVAVFYGASGEWNPTLGDTDFVRVLSTPDFLIFYLLLAGNKLKEIAKTGARSRWINWAMIVACSLVQMLTITRSAIMATVIAVGHSLTRGRSYVFSTMAVAAFCLVLGSVVVFNSSMENRFTEGINDIYSTLDGSFITDDGKFDGNLSFRIGHLYERATYILDDPARWLMGIGMIHEDSPQAANLGFRVGLLDDISNRVVQVDSGDIAWSIILIKMGFVGVAAVLLFLLRSYACVSRGSGIYVDLYKGACVYFLITSFFGSSFSSPTVMLQLMLFLALAIRDSGEYNF